MERTQNDIRARESQHELYTLLWDLWHNGDPTVSGGRFLIIEAEMAERIKAALGIAEGDCIPATRAETRNLDDVAHQWDSQHWSWDPLGKGEGK